MTQRDSVILIPGTRKINNLLNNIGSIQVYLTKQELQQIAYIIANNSVAVPATPQKCL